MSTFCVVITGKQHHQKEEKFQKKPNDDAVPVVTDIQEYDQYAFGGPRI